MAVEVVAPDRDLGDVVPFAGLGSTPVERRGATVHYVDVTDIRRMTTLAQSLADRHYDVVLINSIWNVPLAFIPAISILLGRIQAESVVVMPRGELEPGALHLKLRKKAAAAGLVRAVYSRAVDVFGATSVDELANIKSWIPGMPVLVTDDTPDTIPFGCPATETGSLSILFLGRVHPTKGLLQLLAAIRLLRRPVNLSIVGPIGDAEYWQECQRLAIGLPPTASANFLGTIDRPAIPDLLHNHDVLVNLTAGENFGHTFAEALQAGCPVIATDKTPWSEVLRSGGGWVIDDRDDARAVAALVDQVAGSSHDERFTSRLRARAAYEEWADKRPANIVEQVLAWRAGELEPR
jgi:glycosyltransferase involved in cell wall biosynthesis